MEAQIKTVVDRQPPTGEPIVYRYHDPKAYPPGGARTAMVRCPGCDVFTPPNAIENGQCLDHARHDNWGPSPSALAFEALQIFNLKLEDEVYLAPEDIPALRREIEKYQRRRKKCRGATQSRKHRRPKQ